jgi:hypothetical protein
MNANRPAPAAPVQRSRAVALLASAVATALVGCETKSSPPADKSPPVTLTSAAPAIDPGAITSVTGGTPETSGNVVKINFPRKDVPVTIDGWSNVPPFMGLTSYIAFTPHEPGHAVAMGDFVLFEDEVNPAMSAALEHGLEVTALHNHFFFDKPRVYFMHVGGMGPVEEIAAGVKAMMDAARAARQNGAAPRDTFGRPPVSVPSHVDASKLDSALGAKGKAQDGMYKATFGRNVTSAMCGGCQVGGTMGINTWAAFAGSNEDAVVDGDFAVTEDELQPVLKTLRAGGINIVAIHSHTMGENPRILFFHYWARGAAADLAKAVKAGVDKTAWEGRPAP